MSLTIAQSFAWNLATTLMVVVILYRRGDDYAVLPATEFEGSPDQIISEYDPFQP